MLVILFTFFGFAFGVWAVLVSALQEFQYSVFCFDFVMFLVLLCLVCLTFVFL